MAQPIAAREAAPGHPRLLLRKVAPGTQDATVGPAMSADQRGFLLNQWTRAVGRARKWN